MKEDFDTTATDFIVYLNKKYKKKFEPENIKDQKDAMKF